MKKVTLMLMALFLTTAAWAQTPAATTAATTAGTGETVCDCPERCSTTARGGGRSTGSTSTETATGAGEGR